MAPRPARRLALRRAAANLAFLGLGTLAALVAGEAMVRLFAPQERALAAALHGLHQPDPELGYVMVPGFQRRIRTPEFECDVRTNSLGMHDREPGPRSPGRFRVVGLGDSFVFGVHSGALERCFLKRLESILDGELGAHPIVDARGRTWSGIELLNAGVDGYGTRQEVGLLERLGPEVQPDAVLLAFYLGNDFTDNSGRTRMTVVDGYQILEASAQGYRERYSRADYRFRVWLHAHSELYLLLKRRLVHPARRVRERRAAEAAPAPSSKPFDYFVYDSGFAECLREPATPQLERSMQATRDALLQLRQWCDSHQARAVVVAIPSELQVSREARTRWLARFGLDPTTLDFSLPNRRLAALVEEVGLPLVDLTPALSELGNAGASLYLRLDDHWNAAGHEAAASALASGPLLDDLLGVPSPLLGNR